VVQKRIFNKFNKDIFLSILDGCQYLYEVTSLSMGLGESMKDDAATSSEHETRESANLGGYGSWSGFILRNRTVITLAYAALELQLLSKLA
jgi:hypothetical protein